MKRQEAIERIMHGLTKLHGLCPHPYDPTVQDFPLPTKECKRCVAEIVADYLEESSGLRWEP